jgi:tungstate transport system ATP-binding protein
MNDSTTILEVRDLQVKRGGTVLLRVPSLSIRKGEILSLIGPNGSGKTTLLQTLSYLLKPSGGEVLFKGERVNSNHSVLEYRRRLAMVFQEPLLFDTNVFKNVASGLKIRRMEKEKIEAAVKEHLERFGIKHLSHRSARTLSGGEAQRTSLARAFAIQPEILLLDEPFASLDPPTRESLMDDLERILRQSQTTTILATHDRLEALRLSDRIAVMKSGEILQIGSPEEVMNQPADEFVASFVGVETVLTGQVMKGSRGTFIVAVSGREIEAVGEARAGESVTLCIRPENVTLSTDPSRETTSARNLFAGRITRLIPMGLFCRVQLDCGFPIVAYVTNRSLENLALKEGKEITVSFKATAIHVVRRTSR